MSRQNFPLAEVSISDIYNGIDDATYEIPIYQRNYAWEKEEIEALVRDIYDAMAKEKPIYYVGTLVTFHKGDNVFEVIDGQQRLTTIYLILSALHKPARNKLTYHARRKSSYTLMHLEDEFLLEEFDKGILNGFRNAKEAIECTLQNKGDRDMFVKYFVNNVHLIHYNVPKDVDLNHYFEVMNSRGEQLEKHEIVKAKLLSMLTSALDRERFATIWNECSEMNVYIQQKMPNPDIFGQELDSFILSDFDSLQLSDYGNVSPVSIRKILTEDFDVSGKKKVREKPDTFQPIIDFPNFLLIVLKLTRAIFEKDFVPEDFTLDDKELLNEFDTAFRDKGEVYVKQFAFSLLRAKFFLDNYVAHHSNEDDVLENNPWRLQYWQKEEKGYFKNLAQGNDDLQQALVHLLSMFEVSFTARQRKNYLFYVMLHLFTKFNNLEKYKDFLEWLAEKYLHDVYLIKDNLNEINTPRPGSFDKEVIARFESGVGFADIRNTEANFDAIYGDGNPLKYGASKGIPLFIFNYLDYKIWRLYSQQLKGERQKAASTERKNFFSILGCDDIDLNTFKQFYFSRTRRSLEHFYPQANTTGPNAQMDDCEINCFGNYAMIGAAVNSTGSNHRPKAKLSLYLDSSGKIPLISVASLKFMIMMRICQMNQTDHLGREWTYSDVKEHQQAMTRLLLQPICESGLGLK